MDTRGNVVDFAVREVSRTFSFTVVVGNGATQDTFLKSQGKFFLSFLRTHFYIFLTPKNYKLSL